MKVYTLPAFSKDGKGGNPAGVVLFPENLTDIQMQKMAEKVGYSETAFVMPSDRADFKVRFFTPSEEVDLCGHATVAAFYLLFRERHVKAGFYTQETKAGILKIEVKEDGQIFLQQARPQFLEILPKERVAVSLNLPVESIDSELPVEAVTTGLKDIMVPVKKLGDLLHLKPDFEKIEEISREYDAVGYHVFSLETIQEKAAAHCRNFAPLFGIPEESATGTASGALASFLWKHQKNKSLNLTFEQGYSMERPSEIYAQLQEENHEIINVTAGGYAVFMQELQVEAE